MGRPVARKKIHGIKRHDKKPEPKLGGIDHTARSDEGTIEQRKSFLIQFSRTNEKTRRIQTG